MEKNIKKKYRITVMSDTHWKFHELTNYLESVPQDPNIESILIHAGDLSGRGYEHEIREFCKWLNNKKQYKHKIFIPGNHDWLFQDSPEKAKKIVDFYEDIDVLVDDLYCVGDDYGSAVKIWGSPWQPEFFNWAFNLPRGGDELKEKWNEIPLDTDILITHGPPQTILDVSGAPYNKPLLGCELLKERIDIVKPKIHVFGHIHNCGYKFKDGTHFINASSLNEKYEFTCPPLTFDWDKEKNEINFL